MSKRTNHFSITQDRWIQRARITKEMRFWAESLGIKIIRAKVGDHSKIGIHLLEAEQFELENALDRAERDNFPAIYLHTFKTWRAGEYEKRFKRLLEFTLIQGGRSVAL